jgi:pyrroline-5-carboxylate reductase
MKLGIIGCGNMGSALVRGILSKKVLPFNSVYVSDKDSLKTRVLHKRYGIFVSPNDEIAKKCQYIILAVKPQDSEKMLRSLVKTISGPKHIISIMAGITIRKIESFLGKKIAITRAMPNMAALAQKSVTCLSHNKSVRDKSIVQRLFSTVGDVIEVEEKNMDAVTAISGSGPAYFFYLVECLRDRGRA